MSLVIGIVVLFLSFVFYKYFRYAKYMQKQLRNIPAPAGLPIVGHVLYFTNPKEILNDLIKMARDHDGFLKFHFFQVYTILVADAEKIEKILGTTRILHKSLEYNHFERWLGTGLLTSEPEKWRKTRKMLTPTFHFQILEQFIDIYNSASRVLVDKLLKKADGKKFDVYPDVTLCTLDVICETAMGTSVNAQRHSNSVYVKSVQIMNEIIRTRLFSPLKRFDFVYYLSPEYRMEKKALATIHGYTMSVIKKRKRELELNGNLIQDCNGENKKRLAFLDLLLQCELDGKPLTNEEIREEVDTFMFEGHDTTASAIAFSLHCLAENPHAQDQAVKELLEIFTSKDEHITYAHLQQMKYLEKVMKEVLRLYPSVPMFGRQLEEDSEFEGEIIPKGVTLTIFPYGMHRDAKLYPDPEKFDPERFTLENQNKRNPFGYVPFSAGPRNCIGQRFAMLEMKTTLSNLIRNFEILPAEGYKPVLVPNVILKSLNGVEICLKERNF
ncbi:cytochrome P450 [Oryctes borbonicus]|uniref:Cytochrome P450 n=1 Tax=Oryctes borbonicus TaxID=1629725 RepID=A0A0T6AVK3_9SCAR|nr:cytochrome P450 [Oryctes borbonicus]